MRSENNRPANEQGEKEVHSRDDYFPTDNFMIF